MQETIACLTGLIGLSDTTCNCWDGTKPADFDALNASKTGYYITDPEYGFSLLSAVFNAQDCGDGSIWDTLQKARTRAIIDFHTDFQTAVYQDQQSRFKRFTGYVGKVNKLGVNNLATKNFAGNIYRPLGMKGGVWNISKIRLGVSCSGPVVVNFAANQPITYNDTEYEAFQVFHSETVTAVANNHADLELTTPVSLPMYIDGCPDLRYYVYYDATTCKPVQNQFTCCASKPDWMQYLQAQGFWSDDLETVYNTHSYSQGLLLYGSLECEDFAWLCSLNEVQGYNGEQLIGRTIQMKSAVKLISHVLGSGNINSYTLLNRESLYARRGSLNKSYKNNIDFMAQNIPDSVTDCFTCKEKKIKRRAILV